MTPFFLLIVILFVLVIAYSLAPNEEKIAKNRVIGRDLSNAFELELKTNVNNEDSK